MSSLEVDTNPWKGELKLTQHQSPNPEEVLAKLGAIYVLLTDRMLTMSRVRAIIRNQIRAVERATDAVTFLQTIGMPEIAETVAEATRLLSELSVESLTSMPTSDLQAAAARTATAKRVAAAPSKKKKRVKRKSGKENKTPPRTIRLHHLTVKFVRSSLRRSTGFPQTLQEALITGFGDDWRNSPLPSPAPWTKVQIPATLGEDVDRGSESWVLGLVAKGLDSLLHPNGRPLDNNAAGLLHELQQLGDEQTIWQQFASLDIHVPS